MKLKAIIVGISVIGSSFKLFITHPRLFVSRMLQPEGGTPGSAATIAWSLSTIAFILGAYHLVFGSMFLNIGVNIAEPGKGDTAPIVVINSFLKFIDGETNHPMPDVSSIATDMTEESIRNLIGDLKESRGEIIHRKFRSFRYRPDGWSGWPEGSYFLALYDSKFSQADVLEEVISHFDGGTWKVAGYLTIPKQPPASDDRRPEIVDWWWGFGFGVILPDNIDTSKPQSIEIRSGIIGVSIYPVVPDKIFGGTIATLILGLYAFVFVICIHPVAKLMKSRMKFAKAFKLSVTWLTFTALFTVLFLILGMLTLVHGLQMHGLALLLSFMFITMINVAVAIRGFFTGFGELYSFTGTQMFAVSIGSILVASVTTPLTLLPAFLSILYLEPWISLIW